MILPTFDQAKILFVDDEEEILNSLKRIMRNTDADCEYANSAAKGLEILAEQKIDIIVSDIKMPEMNGVEFLAEVASAYPETVRMVLTGHADFDYVMGAINEGKVFGYLHKPWKNHELLGSLKQALQTRSLQLERLLLQRSLSKFERFNRHEFCGFVGDSPEMQMVYQTIETVAVTDASVFITGSSGTGKEVTAEAVHQCSKRSTGPFIALNCAPIPNELVESEIFGHVKGAFTGAVNHREGAASRAHQGTLFLDELAEMDYTLQSKLLRFIQTGTYTKVGSDKLEKADIRFVSATNKDPLKAIDDKELREDLYYRLNVVSIDLPDLKDRLWDSVILAEHYLQQYSEKEGKPISGFTDDAEKLLFHYDWPGNVRQLSNIVNSLVILCQGPLISAGELARALKISDEDLTEILNLPLPYSQRKSSKPVISSNPQDEAAPQAEDESEDDLQVEPTPIEGGVARLEIKALSEMEREIIERAISECDGNVVTAAKKLCVSPSTLYRKIQNWKE